PGRPVRPGAPPAGPVGRRRHPGGPRGVRGDQRLGRPGDPDPRVAVARRAAAAPLAGRGADAGHRRVNPPIRTRQRRPPCARVGSMSEPAPTVWPTLRARDARGLIRFLVDAFGFEEVVTYGDQPDGSGDTVVHAELAWPLGGGLMLGSVREGADEWALTPGTCGCYV